MPGTTTKRPVDEWLLNLSNGERLAKHQKRESASATHDAESRVFTCKRWPKARDRRPPCNRNVEDEAAHEKNSGM
jgi:hypothetical protein